MPRPLHSSATPSPSSSLSGHSPPVYENTSYSKQQQQHNMQQQHSSMQQPIYSNDHAHHSPALSSTSNGSWNQQQKMAKKMPSPSSLVAFLSAFFAANSCCFISRGTR